MTKKTAKKLPKKKAQAIANAFDSAMEPDVVPVPPVVESASEQREQFEQLAQMSPEMSAVGREQFVADAETSGYQVSPSFIDGTSQRMMEEDDFNEFAPPEVSNYGWADDPDLEPEATPEPEAVEAVPAESPALHSPAPVERVEPPVRHIAPETPPEPVSDALVVERLINAVEIENCITDLIDGLSYLWKLTDKKKTKPHDMGILTKRIKRGRYLLSAIKNKGFNHESH